MLFICWTEYDSVWKYISQRLSGASRFSRRIIKVWKPLSQEEHPELPHRLVRHRSHSCPEHTRLSLCHCETWPLLLLGIEVTRVDISWWWDMKYGTCLRLTSLRFMAAQIHLPQKTWNMEIAYNRVQSSVFLPVKWRWWPCWPLDCLEHLSTKLEV